MSALRHRLMYQESEKRLTSAKMLRAAGDASDSAYLLELLAFELLLKLSFEKAVGSIAPGHHRYAEIFGSLSQVIKDEVLRLAGERVGPSELSSNLGTVLKDLGSNFVKLRYPFERYSQMTEEQYEKVGADWVANGAALADAEFRYYPEELLGLTTALQILVRAPVMPDSPPP